MPCLCVLAPWVITASIALQAATLLVHDKSSAEKESVASNAQTILSATGQRKRTASLIVASLRHPPTSNMDEAVRRALFSAPRDGVFFDLDADGVAEQISWPLESADMALLAVDRNGNGMIDNGTELFGAQTVADANDGFTALARLYPHDGDGALGRGDEAYAKLVLWADINRNGRSEEGELVAFSEVFAKIGLGYFGISREDEHHNRFENRGWAVFGRDFADTAADPIQFIFEIVPASSRLHQLTR